MKIREASQADWASIWPFFREIVAAGETLGYDRDMSEAEAREIWLDGPPSRNVPEAFDHPEHGSVSLHVMFRRL